MGGVICYSLTVYLRQFVILFADNKIIIKNRGPQTPLIAQRLLYALLNTAL